MAAPRVIPTDLIDDPAWDDVQQRDALVRWLAHAVNALCEKKGRVRKKDLRRVANEALHALDGTESLPTREELVTDDMTGIPFGTETLT